MYDGVILYYETGYEQYNFHRKCKYIICLCVRESETMFSLRIQLFIPGFFFHFNFVNTQKIIID